MESDSSMATFISASSRWRRAVSSRRMEATLRVSSTAGGITSSEISDSCQDSATMAATVATAVVRFVAMLVAVEVTTACMPPMSLVMRDWISPLRVRVKNPTDWRCRWVKTSERSRCMTCWPMRVADPGLEDTEHGGGHGHGQHAGGQQDQQAQVVLGQGGVDDGTQQEGGGHRDGGGGNDDRRDQQQLPAVGR